MKIKAGQSEAKLDVDIGKISNIYWRHSNGDANCMIMVTPSKLEEIKTGFKTLVGRPLYACTHGKRLLFIPIAADDGEIEISYYPPLQKI